MVAKLDGTNGLLQSYDYQAPTTGFSYTFAAGIQTLIMNPAGTLATGTITMPAAPSDGMTITISTSKTITALTLQGNTGQSISNTITSLPANTTAQYMYRLSNTTWYPSDTVPVASAAAYAGPSSTRYTTAGSFTFTIPSGVTQIKVTVVGGGGGASSASGCTFAAGGAGGTSSISSGTQTISTVSATGGPGSTGNNSGLGAGLGSGGDINGYGQTQSGQNYSSAGGSIFSFGAYSAGVVAGRFGSGGTINSSGLSNGGGGGHAIKWLTGLTPGNTISVTVGAGGTCTYAAATGGAGVVLFEY